MKGNGLSVKGVKSALKRMERIASAVDEQIPGSIDEAVKQYGLQAQDGYDNAMYDGKNDVVVLVEKLGSRTWQIIASGKSLLFIEFGTGIIYPHTSPIEHPFNYPGSWSVSHSQYLTDSEKLARHKGQWPYNGEWVDGNPSANVMYEVFKNARYELPANARAEIRKVMR